MKNETAAHTPTPWRTDGDGQAFGPNPEFDPSDMQSHEEILICDAAPDNSALTEYDQANMDFIVRAANCHADLVSACQELVTWAESCSTAADRTPGHWPMFDRARAVLEKAGAK